MRPVMHLLLFLLAMMTALPAAAGGAWPRGKGNVFASISWTTFGDVEGYLAQVSHPIVEGRRVELENELGLYAEIGLSERLTFGLDRHTRPESDINAAIWFLRGSLGDLSWRNRYAVEIGLGPVQDWRGLEDTMMRTGFAWGRGFETRWADGWVDVDAKAGWQMEAEEGHWKLDTTVGFKPGERNLVYLQMQSGGIESAPAYLRAVPTYVRRLGHGLSVESALQLGLHNDDAQGVKLGTWFEF
ncbi:hypothetical protein [Tropicimonas sediminicola]|uniref:Uncharacterized protein n=1 Tax=Tropicimonas sediminicola TaxID=1031541 RepID=A0A239LTG5_9RHOB|nr:hypothetical protein [Tropicimonas sediminicola]SNT33731.1 hypothetical protein SAMN05421757_11140 [Tropicimonas sediminicola]